MILINFNSVNTIFEKISIYNKFVNFNFTCPNCYSHNFSFFGSYSRNLIVLHNDAFIDLTINIKRVLCKSCNHTHALIPNFIVPYKVYTKDAIVFCLYKYCNYNNLSKVQNIFNVDRQLILNWKNQFNIYLSFICTFYSSVDIKYILNMLFIDVNFCFEFFIKFMKIFLLNHNGSIFNYIST